MSRIDKLLILLITAILVFSGEISHAQNSETVTGIVLDSESGEALPGVNVVIIGTSIGTATDLNGEFSLDVPNLETSLVFTFVGYDRMEIPIDGRTELTIEMTPAYLMGDDLVVVGYGMQRRSDMTGSISSIDREAITSEPVYSIENVLQGRSAGVNVTANSFRPGEGASIRIRGTRSFVAGNEPLLVMDGIPMEGNLMDINPRDVESIEILKDASATAIYGSRGANGVILVTTRRGTEGINIEYSGMAGLQYTTDRINVMDTQSFAEMVREAARRDGIYTGNDEDIFREWELDAIQNNRTTDWQDLVFDTGYQQQHSLSVRGGSNGTMYSITGTIDDHLAVVRNNDFTRYSLSVNLDQRISSWLNVGLTTNFNNSLQHRSVSFENVVGNFPMASAYDSEGNVRMIDEIGDRNPLFDLQRENNLNRTARTRIYSSIFSEANISENVMIRMNFSPDFTFRENGFYIRDDISQAGIRDDKETSLLYEALIYYNNTFRGSHRLNLTSMYSIQNYDSQFSRLEVEGLPYEGQLYHNLGSAETVTHRSSFLSNWKLESYMLRTNYIFDDRYLFTLTGRVDGSSRLAPGNKYGLFPSMAIAWQIGNESFMENVDIFSELKLRFSIGEVGNTGIQPYQTQGTLQQLYYAFGQDLNLAFAHGDIPNPDLRWERTRSVDLGVDFALLEDRFHGSIDIYQSNTKDLLLERQLPITSGYSRILENVGETRNRGFEFTFSSVNIHTSSFQWSTDLNFATNRNEIIELFGGQDDDPGSGWFIGHPINVNYEWKLDGIWQLNEADEAARYGAQPGDYKFLDVTGSGSITGSDRVIQGSPDPKWTAGISNRLAYTNWDLSVFVYAAQGMMTRTEFGSSAFGGLFSFRPQGINNIDVDFWTPENPSNTYPQPRNTAQISQYAHSIMNTSYVRVRNITLGYNFSQQLISRLGVRNARIYSSVQNPFTFTSFPGYDPEGATGLEMPNYRTFLLGIDLSF